MLRLANNSDLFPGRKVIPCHNLSTAEYYIKHENELDDEDWVEWEDAVLANYFVVNDEAGYN